MDHLRQSLTQYHCERPKTLVFTPPFRSQAMLENHLPSRPGFVDPLSITFQDRLPIEGMQLTCQAQDVRAGLDKPLELKDIVSYGLNWFFCLAGIA